MKIDTNWALAGSNCSQPTFFFITFPFSLDSNNVHSPLEFQLQDPYTGPHPPSDSFKPKISSVVYFKMFHPLQNVIWLNPEGWKYKKVACSLHRNTEMKLMQKWYISFHFFQTVPELKLFIYIYITAAVKMGTTEYHSITNYISATNILNEYGKWLNWQWLSGFSLSKQCRGGTLKRPWHFALISLTPSPLIIYILFDDTTASASLMSHHQINVQTNK